MKSFNKLLSCVIVILLLIASLSSCRYSYDEIRELQLYDRIVYNGTDYYFMDHAPDLKTAEDTKTLITDKKVQVIIADENGIPYDSNKTEEAWTFAGIDGKIYINFGSRYWTDNKAQAAEYYEFDTLGDNE